MNKNKYKVRVFSGIRVQLVHVPGVDNTPGTIYLKRCDSYGGMCSIAEQRDAVEQFLQIWEEERDNTQKALANAYNALNAVEDDPEEHSAQEFFDCNEAARLAKNEANKANFIYDALQQLQKL